MRKASLTEEELREMQLRILKEDSEETAGNNSVMNPFNDSHQQ